MIISRPRTFDYEKSGVRAPRVGERGCYHSPVAYENTRPIWPEKPLWFTVTRTDSSICYHVYDEHEDGRAGHFIWRFNDGPNSFHSWPSHDPLDLLKDDPKKSS